jgi:hypothetical protein
MKNIAGIIICLILIIIIAWGINFQTDAKSKDTYYTDRFTVERYWIDELGHYIDVVTDNETGVEYLGGDTVMYNADGSIKVKMER